MLKALGAMVRGLLPVDIRYVQAAHAGACLIAAVTVAVNPSEYPAWIVLFVLLLQFLMGLVADKRARASYQRGKWDERLWVVNSLEEAAVRGMSPADWFMSYAERVQAEANDIRE
jgi:hypothetical protein